MFKNSIQSLKRKISTEPAKVKPVKVRKNEKHTPANKNHILTSIQDLTPELQSTNRRAQESYIEAKNGKLPFILKQKTANLHLY